MKRQCLCQALIAAAVLFGVAGLRSAPLAWFPGPPLQPPMSGTATVVSPGLGNVLIGGDGFAYYDYPLTYPQSLLATNSAWMYLPAIYSLNIAPGAAANGDLIVVYGGTDGTNSTSAAIAYSPSGDTVPPIAPMSVPRAYLGYTADAAGNAYAIGGLDAAGQPLASAERYSPDANTWTGIAPLPTPRYDFPAVFNNANLIYVFGGRTNTSSGTEIASVLRYSVTANTWTSLAPMPIPVAGSAAAYAVDGKFYVVGGVSGGVTLNVVQAYTPGSDSWVLSTPLPEGLSASAMGVDSLGRLIVMGGRDATGNDVGDVWRSQQLGVPDSAPGFTQYPATNGVYLQPYSSSITATGSPPPLYLLLSGPGGMQVDVYSGAIAWTPDVTGIGTNPVTIRATNYAGFVDWHFTVTIPNPPPTTPTNLTVVSVTDNSAVLSWAPESPVAGAVTYSLGIPHPWHSPRGSGGGVNWQVVATGLTSPTVTISGLAPGSSTTFAVSATGPGGTSAWSSWAAVRTTAPQGPTALFITGLTSTSVSLAWTPSPGPAQNPLYSAITSYTIMERMFSPVSNIPTVTGITGTNGTISALTPGSSHFWFVSGIDAAGNASPLGAVYLVVTNPVPVPPLAGGARYLPDGTFELSVQELGSIVQTVVIEANGDLTNPAGWVQIDSVFPGASAFTLTDTNARQFPRRFYRIVAP
jgi:hypothetical protein